jgi:hypothetical protein
VLGGISLLLLYYTVAQAERDFLRSFAPLASQSQKVPLSASD